MYTIKSDPTPRPLGASHTRNIDDLARYGRLFFRYLGNRPVMLLFRITVSVVLLKREKLLTQICIDLLRPVAFDFDVTLTSPPVFHEI